MSSDIELIDSPGAGPSRLSSPRALSPTNLTPAPPSEVENLMDNCHRVLTDIFGHSDYKGKQKEIFAAAVKGLDVLVIAPTGMGKSACFQIPAIADDYGVTLVVSPLLALMKNQISRLRQLKVAVGSLSSDTPEHEKKQIIQDLCSRVVDIRLLYVTPERLQTSDFMRVLEEVYSRHQLRRLVVDEAHCISEWGHDFREEYRKLDRFRLKFPDVPIMALTASATPVVQSDIVRSLRLDQRTMYKIVHPFNRENLFYEVRYHSTANTMDQCDAVFTFIANLHERRGRPSSGIVYCRSKKQCDELSNYLRGKGIAARPYHRGIRPHILDKTLKEWEVGGDGQGGVDVVCATIAFGMGVDKGNVRYIVHFDLPKSMEAYYQETGRAGRDGEAAKCVMFYSREDALYVRKLVNGSHGKRVNSYEQGDAPPPSQRSLDSLGALIAFAENTVVCRHILICKFFGEPIPKDADSRATYCARMCDVCKYPDRTRARQEALTAGLVPGAEDFSSRIPVIRATGGGRSNEIKPTFDARTRAYPPQRANPGWVEAARLEKDGPGTKGKEKQQAELPSVPTGSTVMAPSSRATAPYRGPGLLKSSLKRTSSSGSDSASSTSAPGSSAPKRVRTDYSSGAIGVRHSAGNGRAGFKVPFKAPRPAPAKEREITPVIEIDDEDDEPVVVDRDESNTIPPYVPLFEPASESDDEELTLTLGPALPPTVVELDAAFSNKIPASVRLRTFTSLRCALHTVVPTIPWATTIAQDADAIARAASSLEFGILSLSASEAGYASRARRVVEGARKAKDKRAWVDGEDEKFEEAREAVRALRAVCGKGSGTKRKR
ncbi:unnamed protein product [Peniophora sp. CBMAI 1063]|nr:unnamed protein product [Peniophora sp. CBMAI 1063]